MPIITHRLRALGGALKGRWLRLRSDRKGAVALFLAVAVIPLVGIVGIATDAARGYLVKSRLGQALDAAGLAGGRDIFSAQLGDNIDMYFDANSPPGFMNASVQGPDYSVDESNEFLTVTATATVQTTFMRLFGYDSISVSAETVIKRVTRGMELVLVMDNTGSMRSSGKMDAMKQAATDMMDILYGSRETIDDFWVALVPYAATVNIGSGRTSWLVWEEPYTDTNANGQYDPEEPYTDDNSNGQWDAGEPYTDTNGNSQWDAAEPFDDVYDNDIWDDGYNPDEFLPTTWKGCVEAREAPYDQDDSTPSVQSWQPHLWESTLGVYPDTGDNDWPPVDEANGAQNDGTGPNLGCGPAITPLVAEKSTIVSAIDEMLPWHRGGTMANLGLAWGWRVLSPDWRGMWGGDTPAELPLDYGTALMEKVVVILTDGVNQWYDWPGGLPGQPDQATYPDADYTAYGRLSEGRLGTTNNGDANDEINDRMLAACNAMKAEGIILYTITFKLSNSTTQQLYRDCATDDEHYFNSPTNEDLADAFHQIGEKLSNLLIFQ